MPTYRVEECPNNRAICKNAECKANAVKIMKGELRFATLVEIKEHQSWSYKHWGCVTPVQINNFYKATEDGDIKYIDGYEELPAKYQQKILQAFKDGHVADEDWKGDVEVNRHGMKGFRIKTPKKKKGEDEEMNGSEPESPVKGKKRSRAKKEADDEEDEAPAPKKARGKASKAKAADEDAPAPKKARAKSKKVKDEHEDGSDQEAAPPAKKPRGKASKVKAESEEDDEVEAPAPKKKSRAKAKKAAPVANSDEPDVPSLDGTAEEKPQAKAGRKKKAAVKEGASDAEEKVEVVAPRAKGRGKKKT